MPLTERQAQIAARVASGKPAKQIAEEMGLAVKTVQNYTQAAAERVPGGGSPRHRLTLFFLNVVADGH